ncbi:AAA family ATPase [Kribbella albertanoniae]|uniref:LuxR family transcriptional regulator n=1 Tax=Kribbella albertanoniae TaxID=1266829 RepID=A0A4R4QFI4_9ACTN|nr:LuxR family transcriptional regulator [Kribbella albertanoniae]TDC34009.1 LuxR family transcriptional regulator [Kribbella albertanoniae]
MLDYRGGYFMGLSAGNLLLEREHQLEVMTRALAAATTGDGRCLLISGEAGVGKTSLVERFIQSVGPEVRVLRGACDDLYVTRPLGAFRDAMRGMSGPLATALESADQEAILNGLDAEFSGPDRVVLLLEDVHWADEATIDLLHYLLRRLNRWPLLMLLTLRPEDLSRRQALRRLLAVAVGDAVHRVSLDPLSSAAVETLAAGSGWRPLDLAKLTGGNPFYVTEVLAAPREGVPLSVRDVVLARVAHLDPESIAVLEQLSVIPMSIDTGLASDLLGGRLELATAAESLGMLVIQTTHGSHTIAFRHELARRAVESSLSALRRRRLNQRVLDTMLASRTQPELARLVHHAVEAGAIDRIIEFAPAAGYEAAEAGSHDQALMHFELALRHAGSLSEHEVTELLSAHCWQLYLAGHYSQAVSVGKEAVERLQTAGDSIKLAEAFVRLSRCQYLDGDTDGAIESADRAVDEAGRTPSLSAQAAAVTEQSIVGVLAGVEGEQAIARLRAAHAVAIEARRDDLAALSLNYLGVTLCNIGDLDGLRYLHQSLAVATAAKAHEATGRAYINLSQMLYRLERWDELTQIIETGLEYTHEHALWGNLMDIELHRAMLLVRRGQWQAAQSIYARAHIELSDPGRQNLYLLMFEARLLVRSGHPEAEARLRLVRSEAARQQSPVGISYAGIATLEWCWLHEHSEQARRAWAELNDLKIGHVAIPLLRQAKRLMDLIEGVTPDDWSEAAERWRRLNADYDEALELASSGLPGPTTEAYHIFAGLGADLAARRVRRRLRMLGVASLPRAQAPETRANPAGLTSREQHIATLVAGGMTNSDIADELVVSVRTVDHHVAAILRKLSVSSRRHVAQRAHDLGISLDNDPQ